MESIGVIPEPAAMHRCLPPAEASARKLPEGGCTSMTSPGRTSRTSHREKSPSGTSRTPMRGAVPAGAQIE